jgi:hypothetical protein
MLCCITLRPRLAPDSRTDSPLPPLTPPSPRWAMEGDFIWPRALLSRANMTVPYSDDDAQSASSFPRIRIRSLSICPHPSGWAEERSRKRIRASDCLSEASSSSTPLSASTAGCPQRSGGTQTIGSPFFWVLFFGDAKKSASPAGARPGLQEDPQPYKLAQASTLRPAQDRPSSARTAYDPACAESAQQHILPG